ncbi:MAG TPA: AI-2E family transporter [Candidatus Limnocylindrales bacterium]|nr:AI-2E family transporter [Candidatus Limnocylindrales bacterium]
MAGGDLVPGWLRRLGALGWRILAVLAMVVVLVSIAVRLSTVTASIIFAILVAASVAPAYRYVRTGRGWAASKSAAVLCVVALGALAVSVTIVLLTFAPYVGQLIEGVREGVTAITSFLSSAGVPDDAVALITGSVTDFQEWIGGAVSNLVGSIADAATVVILGGFLTFYVLYDYEKAWSTAIRDLTPSQQAVVTEHGSVALDNVSAYLRGSALAAGVDALAALIYLPILGVPLAGPLAVVVFLGGFVPYIGPVVASSIVLLVTLGTQGVVDATIVLGLMIAVGLLQRRVLKGAVTRVMPRHPALVVIALPAGAALFGLIGLVAAVPAVILVEAFAAPLTTILEGARRETSTSTLVPTWLDRLAQWSWRGLIVFALIAIAIGAAVAVPGVTVPLVLALVLAATLAQGVSALEARGLGRGQAALATTITSAVLVFGAAALAIIAIGGSVAQTRDVAEAGAKQTGVDTFADLVAAFGAGITTQVFGIFSEAVGLVVAILLALLLTFYLLKDGAIWWDRALAGVSGRRRELLDDIAHRSAGILNGYMIGTGTIALFAAVTQWLIMVLLGLPLAFPVAVLTFFGNFIPYIGGAITTFIGFLVAVAVGTPTDIVLMAIYTLVFNIVQGNFVAPLVYGKTVSLHPAIVLLAIPAGGQIAGILGMFLIVPFLGVVAATWRLVLHVFDPDDAPPVAEGSPSTVPDVTRPATVPKPAAS